MEWISRGTAVGLTVTSAIPRIFEAYATVVVPEFRAGLDEYEQRVVRLLSDHSTDHDWWLGYLDTGASDIVFPDAPRVRMYSDWSYVLVKAGPEQALRWRAEPSPLHCGLPDLMFPTDRSWVISRPCGTTTGGASAGRVAWSKPSCASPGWKPAGSAPTATPPLPAASPGRTPRP